jgi:hypothetical protein
MRNLVQPPSMRCEICDGELRFERIEPDDPIFDTQVEMFVCARCGHEQSCSVIHDPYAAHAASSMPPGKVGQPDGSGSNRDA